MRKPSLEIALLIVLAGAGAFLLWESSADPPTNDPGSVPKPLPSYVVVNEQEPATPVRNSAETASDSVSTEVVRTETKIRVTGLKSQPSSVFIAVFESPEGFPKSERSTKTNIVEADGDHAELSLLLPVKHPVAIAVFQDLDGNRVVSKNGFGIPTEPYGFSNNARGLLGPPTFQQAVVEVHNGQDTLDIQVR